VDNQNQRSISQVIADMSREAKFPAATLSGRDGLLVAAHSNNGDNPARQSAVVAKLTEAANVLRSQMALGTPAELSYTTEDGRRLVCRPFSLNGQDLILAVVVPSGQPYRRATNKAIAQLRSAWPSSPR
jgi:predicted regulator of Ras-like GTPase activity (Roadblock/LC7/MglB family)